MSDQEETTAPEQVNEDTQPAAEPEQPQTESDQPTEETSAEVTEEQPAEATPEPQAEPEADTKEKEPEEVVEPPTTEQPPQEDPPVTDAPATTTSDEQKEPPATKEEEPKEAPITGGEEQNEGATGATASEPEPAATSDEKPKDAAAEDKPESEVQPAKGAPAAAEEEVKSKPPAEEPPPRTKFWSVVPGEGVDLAVEASGQAAMKPITVGQMFQDTYQTYPNRDALFYKEDGAWISVSYSQYYSNCINAAKSFLKLGLEKYHAVAIIGFNSPEWFYSNMGAMFAGGMSAGIYTTNGPEACLYIAEDCKANVIVVENQKQLDKILKIQDQLPDLKAIVQYKGKLSQEYKNVYDWDQFIELGKEMDNSEIESIIKAQNPEECALLVYTSGTTGNPKGVMISHDNLTFTARTLMEFLGSSVSWTKGDIARVISYLPLSHIAGQMADMYLTLYAAATIYFAQPDALKGTLRVTLTEVKPTMFFGVPRVYEKFMEAMKEAAANVGGLKKKLGVWATGKAYQGNVNRQNSRPFPWGWSIANALVLDKLKGRLGLQEAKILSVGAAPIHRSVLEHFMKYNLPVLELYGMSENTGPATLNLITNWRLGSVGKVLPGTQVKIDKPDENGEGEICMYGRHISMGYLNNEQKTREAIDEEGWLHSGDIGKIDKDGYLYITGRIKELIITSGGENIAPVPIEDRIKEEAPFLSNVMLIGDKRKYLSCLVTIKCVMNQDTGEPVDELHPLAATAMQEMGCQLTKPSEIAQQKPEGVCKKIKEALDKANVKAVSNAQKVQKFALLETDFSIPGEELGPTLKLKRRVVVQKYDAVIEAMYAEPPPPQQQPQQQPKEEPAKEAPKEEVTKEASKEEGKDEEGATL